MNFPFKQGPFSPFGLPFPHFGMSPDPRQDPKTVELVEIFMEDSGRWKRLNPKNLWKIQMKRLDSPHPPPPRKWTAKVVPWKGSFV